MRNGVCPIKFPRNFAIAAGIDGTIVNQVRKRSQLSDLRIGHPSGVIELSADVSDEDGWRADRVVVYRTARRLMEGSVLIPAVINAENEG